MDNRKEMAIDWFNKGELAMLNNNVFESFIYLWIAWIIGCKIYISNNYNITIDMTDGIIVAKWAKHKPEYIIQSMKNNKASLKQLSEMKGAKYSNPIIDTGNETLKSEFLMIRNYIQNDFSTEQFEQSKSNIEIAVAFAHLITKIRNNLFHGGKSYTNKKDKQILEAIIPTLRNILQIQIDNQF